MISFQKRERACQAGAIVGIDAGKFSHTLVVRPRGQPDSRPFQFPTTRPGFEAAVGFLGAQAPGQPPHRLLVGIEFAGNYGFTLAHFLAGRGFPVVSVLPAHTKRWKEVAHHQPLKTDAKDAAAITDLLSQGHFVTFPFLAPVYADLRYLTAARARLAVLRRSALNQLRALLQVVFPEFEALFPRLTGKTPLNLLRACPTPEDLLQVPQAKVLELLQTSSRGQLGAGTCARLTTAARETLGLPGPSTRARLEISLALQRLQLLASQLRAVEAAMREALQGAPEVPCLLSIPRVAPLTAAVFLGSLGDPRAYDSSAQVLRVAGLSLVEHSSGVRQGRPRISKRGRPLLRQAAYMFAVRSITREGLFRARYEALCRRNGGQKMKAVVAIMRRGLRLLYSVARDRRMFHPGPVGAA